VTDEELVTLFQGPDGNGPAAADEARAWAEFEAAFGDRIRRTCMHVMRRSGRREEAEDMAQRTREKILRDRYKALRRFRLGEAKMSTWVTRIATNVCYEWLRSRNNPVWAPGDGDPDGPKRDLPDPAPDPFAMLRGSADGKKLVGAMAHCIAELDDKRLVTILTRLLLQVAFEEERPNLSEVGRILGASPQTTKYRMDTAVERLRLCVTGQLTPEGGEA
jgi:RNA polymerase sigma factor (sigma-70 family)